MASTSSINWADICRKRAAEPASLVDRLYQVADALERADKAIEDFYGDELKLMASDRAAQFEAIFPDKPPYFEIAPFAAAIKKMANDWQDELDAPSEAEIEEAREAIRVSEAAGLYAGQLYRDALDVLGRSPQSQTHKEG